MTFRRLHAIILKFSSNTLNTVNMCVNTRVKTPSPNHLLLPGSALFMNTSITSAMQIMWAVHADTCFRKFLKHSVIGKQLRDEHSLRNKYLYDQLSILKKCRRKLDCLIYEMLFIKEKKKLRFTHGLTPSNHNF